MPEIPGHITLLLTELRAENREAESRLVPLVYDELRRMARRHMRGERADHTLQPTALVHEAYLRLVDQREVRWRNRAHFFGVAAQLMRRILVDYARANKAEKRGGDVAKVPLEEALVFTEKGGPALLALDEALSRLHEFDPRQGRIVELRFFAGLTEEEIAAVLGVSARTIKRDWNIARAWLYKEINKTAAPNPSRR
jgi:RNA polymerase sigma-70 factor, ECF subfamily